MGKHTNHHVLAVCGNNIRNCRMKREMTQEMLAEAVECDISTIARIESGTRGPSLGLLLSIADALQVSTDALLRENLENEAFCNIVGILSRQSPESLTHLEGIVRSCVSEYGEPAGAGKK